MADKVVALHDRLAAQVEALVTGEDWARYLTVASRFHRYSPSNLWLILSQRPHATRVAGFRTWASLGRHVVKGAKGIAILAPCSYRRADDDDATADEDQATARVLRGFKIVYVFDEADTAGDPVHDVRPVLLEGDGTLWDALAAQVDAAGFSLARGECGTANGYTDFATRSVVVADHLSGAMADKTLTHDL